MQTLRLGPGFDNYKLTCDIIGNPTPTFTWTSTKADEDFTNNTDKVLELENSKRSYGDLENITCVGTVEFTGESMSFR